MKKIEPVGYLSVKGHLYDTVAAAGVGYERVYTEAQMRQLGEACAAVCEGLVTYPPGHGGQWEGYGPVTTHRNGSECAEEIRTLVKEMLP